MARAGVVNGTCWHRQWFVLLMDKSSDPVYWLPIYHRRLLGVICPDQPATACRRPLRGVALVGIDHPLAGERSTCVPQPAHRQHRYCPNPHGRGAGHTDAALLGVMPSQVVQPGDG